MNILVVDNTLLPRFHGSHDLCAFGSFTPNAHFHVRRAPEQDLPKDLLKYDKVIISGSKTSALDQSPWVEKLTTAIKKWVEYGIPVLGVCYGHQAISLALNGTTSVRKSKVSEYGWTKIKIEQDSVLLKGLSTEFWTLSFHEDEVFDLNPELKITASSDHCAIQAFEHQTKPVFGIQFHPEKTLEDALQAEVRFKKQKMEFLRSGQSKKLYSEEVGNTIFKNFLSL